MRRTAALAAVLLTIVGVMGLRTTTPASASADGTDTPGVFRNGTWYLSNVFGGTGDWIFGLGQTGDVPVVGDWDGNGTATPGVVRGQYWYLSNGYSGSVDRSLVYGNPGDIPVVGDWNHDGIDTPGVVRGQYWYLSDTFNATVDHALVYGNPGDVPVVGDWNGDGADTPGVFRGSNWYLSDTFNATVDHAFNYGLSGDTPVGGDWNHDGRDTPGVFRPSTANWYLSDSFGGVGDHIFNYGLPGDRAVAGDFDAVAPPPPPPPPPPVAGSGTYDGTDTAGVFRGSNANWYSQNSFGGAADRSYNYGLPNDRPVAGDYNNDGIDTPGVMRGDTWWLSDSYGGTGDYIFKFGLPGDRPLVGDWNGDNVDTPGVQRNQYWFLSDSFGGNGDHNFVYGNPGDIPVAGDWDGDGADSVGVYRNGWWYLSNDFHATVNASFFFGGQAGDKPVVGDWDDDGVDTPGIVRGNQWLLMNTLGGAVTMSFSFGLGTDTPVVGDWAMGPLPDSEFQDEGWEGSGFDPCCLSGTLARRGVLSAQQGQVASPVFKYAPRVWLEAFDTDYPARAYFDYIRKASLNFSKEGFPWANDKKVAGIGQVVGKRMGSSTAGPCHTYALTYKVTHHSRTYWACDYTAPRSGEPPTRNGLGDREGYYLNIPNSMHSGPSGNFDNSLNPVYFQYVPGRYITYYFFYVYDRGTVPDVNHEGDWEQMKVHLNASNVATELGVYRHGCTVPPIPWSTVPRVPGSQHPVIYSAWGDHASYLDAGLHSNCQNGAIPPDVTDQGRAWNTWNYMADVTKQSWYGFGGAWGEVGNASFTTGPLGPSQWKDAKDPNKW